MTMNFVEEFKRTISIDAEDLVSRVFPEKTLQLDALLQKVILDMENLPKIREKSLESLSSVTSENNSKPSTSSTRDIGEPPSKLMKTSDVGEGDTVTEVTEPTISFGKEVKSNDLIEELMKVIRPEIIALIEACNTVRTWVMLLLPKMEDGNNFGVSVQEETMSELKGVETETAMFLETLSVYFIARAKVSSKVMKHPKIRDYARFIAEEDEKQFVSLRHIVSELRNFYTSLHDLIMKNIEKIKKPKNFNHGSMY